MSHEVILETTSPKKHEQTEGWVRRGKFLVITLHFVGARYLLTLLIVPQLSCLCHAV
jgi:hypothetical protein